MNLCLYDNCYDDDDDDEEYSRNPALAGLDGKESEHGREAIVVVEILPVNVSIYSNSELKLKFELKKSEDQGGNYS